LFGDIGSGSILLNMTDIEGYAGHERKRLTGSGFLTGLCLKNDPEAGRSLMTEVSMAQPLAATKKLKPRMNTNFWATESTENSEK